jgi:hypothetical protein
MSNTRTNADKQTAKDSRYEVHFISAWHKPIVFEVESIQELRDAIEEGRANQYKVFHGLAVK